MSGPHYIDAELSDDIKAHIAFAYSPATEPSQDEPEGCKEDVWIEYIQQLGIAPPIAPHDLEQKAHDWLFNRGGFAKCCQLAKDQNGSWE